MDKKISQLDPAAALDGTELLAVVQGGSTLKSTISAINTYLTGIFTPYLDGNFFKKGGNSFGSTAVLGTNDGYGLELRTNSTARITINSTGQTGVQVAPSPSHRLTIGASTSSMASLKIPSGTLLTTPIDGSIENDGTNLYYTDDTDTRLTLLTTTSAASTYVPLTRQLTINGTTYDLSANRSWTVDTLPSQSGQNGKYLTTDGATASWATISTAVETLAQTLGAGNTSGAYDILMNTTQRIGFKDGDNINTSYISNNQTTAGSRTAYLPLFDGQLAYHAAGVPLTTNYVLKGTTNGAITSSSLIYDNGTNVGIGTTTLSALLTIKGTSNALADYSLISKNLAGTRGIELNNEGQFNLFGSLSISLGTATTSQRLNIADDSSNIVMRVDGASGATELGLGASNFARLRIYKQGDHGVQVGVSGSDDEYTAYSVYDGSNFRVRIEKSGNAGFGTGLVPSARLHSKGSTSDSSAYALKVDNSSNNALLYVKNDGNVGIGISTPTEKLSIFSGTITGLDLLRIKVSTNPSALNVNDANWVSINSDTRVGTESLYVNGTIASGEISIAGTNMFRFGGSGFSTITSPALDFVGTMNGGYQFNGFGTLPHGVSRLLSLIPQSNDGAIARFFDDVMTVRTIGNISTQRGVIINSTTLHASAILQIDSTTQGVLLPRMTTAQRDAIATPASGLEIYNTSTTSPNYYDGTTWQQVTNKSYVDTNIVSAQVPARLFNYYNFI